MKVVQLNQGFKPTSRKKKYKLIDERIKEATEHYLVNPIERRTEFLDLVSHFIKLNSPPEEIEREKEVEQEEIN